jgi:predicted TIM-barrel fold metal-dependent hydrolase
MDTGLIDVHAHHLPGFYVQEATAAGHAHPDGMGSWPTWSAKAHLDLMDRNGIRTAMLSMSSPGVHFGDDKAARTLARNVNEYTAELVNDHPGRFGNFASLPLPDVDRSIEEIAYVFDELRADGVTLLTNTHGVYLGDARLESVFAELDRRSAAVFLHPTAPAGAAQTTLGRPSAMVEYLFDTARTVADMLFAGVFTRYPNLRVIVPHCGGALPVLADRIEEFMRLFLAADSSLATDAVEQLRGLYYDTAGTAFPRQAPALLQLADPGRVLFGSDYCWTPPALADAHIAAIDAAGPPAPGTTWRSLMTANSQRLFSSARTAGRAP